MTVNGVNGVSAALSSAELERASAVAAESLDKDAFLRLLITEISNQDPLDPMSDREVVSQMAQFSTLEQVTNAVDTLDGISGLGRYSAVSYLGKTITFVRQNDDGTNTNVSSPVTAVWYDANRGVILETELGEVPLQDVEGVA